MGKDYYKIMGLTDEDKKLQGEAFKKVLNKKFRELSLKYHPDRYATKSEEERKAAEEKFKEINEANSILSDEKARAKYDGGGISSDDINEFMKSHFCNFAQFFVNNGDFFGGERENVGDDIMITINVTLEEAFKGGYKDVTINKKVSCKHCNGTGSEDGKVHPCPKCGGSGYITNVFQRDNSIFTQRMQCPDCHGSGTIPSEKCYECGGTGFKTESVVEKVVIPAGIDTDMAIRLQERGHAAFGGGINGDLTVVYKVSEDSYFRRHNSINLIHYDEVPFNECLLGFKKEYKTIDGGKVFVDAPECTPDGKQFIFKGYGMPNVNNPQVRGDYVIIIKYKYPSNLTDKQREKLKDFSN